MVPTVVFPPFTLFTDQVTLLVEPVTVEVNCVMLLSKTVAAVGETVTETPAAALWQPAATALAASTKHIHRVHGLMQSPPNSPTPRVSILRNSNPGLQKVRLTANRKVLAGSKKLMRCGLTSKLLICGTN